jgi:hypothetical protein
MSLKPIITPNIDTAKLAGMKYTTDDKTKSKIKSLHSEIHRETEDSELDKHIIKARNTLKQIPNIGDQSALELIAHLGLLLEISAIGLSRKLLR